MVDVIERDDLEGMRGVPETEKAKQALELMKLGIRLKRSALRARNPEASDDQIDALLQRWLDRAPGHDND